MRVFVAKFFLVFSFLFSALLSLSPKLIVCTYASGGDKFRKFEFHVSFTFEIFYSLSSSSHLLRWNFICTQRRRRKRSINQRKRQISSLLAQEKFATNTHINDGEYNENSGAVVKRLMRVTEWLRVMNKGNIHFYCLNDNNRELFFFLLLLFFFCQRIGLFVHLFFWCCVCFCCFFHNTGHVIMATNTPSGFENNWANKKRNKHILIIPE